LGKPLVILGYLLRERNGYCRAPSSHVLTPLLKSLVCPNITQFNECCQKAWMVWPTEQTVDSDLIISNQLKK
jgi:hypothetical protein